MAKTIKLIDFGSATDDYSDLRGIMLLIFTSG